MSSKRKQQNTDLTAEQDAVHKSRADVTAEHWLRLLSGAATGRATKKNNVSAEIIGKQGYPLYR